MRSARLPASRLPDQIVPAQGAGAVEGGHAQDLAGGEGGDGARRTAARARGSAAAAAARISANMSRPSLEARLSVPSPP